MVAVMVIAMIAMGIVTTVPPVAPCVAQIAFPVARELRSSTTYVLSLHYLHSLCTCVFVLVFVYLSRPSCFRQPLLSLTAALALEAGGAMAEEMATSAFVTMCLRKYSPLISGASSQVCVIVQH